MATKQVLSLIFLKFYFGGENFVWVKITEICRLISFQIHQNGWKLLSKIEDWDWRRVPMITAYLTNWSDLAWRCKKSSFDLQSGAKSCSAAHMLTLFSAVKAVNREISLKKVILGFLLRSIQLVLDSFYFARFLCHLHQDVLDDGNRAFFGQKTPWYLTLLSRSMRLYSTIFV